MTGLKLLGGRPRLLKLLRGYVFSITSWTRTWLGAPSLRRQRIPLLAGPTSLLAEGLRDGVQWPGQLVRALLRCSRRLPTSVAVKCLWPARARGPRPTRRHLIRTLRANAFGRRAAGVSSWSRSKHRASASTVACLGTNRRLPQPRCFWASSWLPQLCFGIWLLWMLRPYPRPLA